MSSGRWSPNTLSRAGIYPWCRRLWGRRYAWIVAWVYLWAVTVTVTAVAEFGGGFIASLFGIEATREVGLATAVALLVLAMAFNYSGTHMLARVAQIGLGAELIGVIALGLYLLLFQRENSVSVFFDSMGAGGSQAYIATFFGASLAGLFLFYGFEACGGVAEEVDDPTRRIPRAMQLTILIGGVSGLFSYAGHVLAAPNLQEIVDGKVADPIPSILEDTLGMPGSKVFLLIAVTAFVSCVLSLQAAGSRLLYASGRDRMLPMSSWLAHMSLRHAVPTNALLVACVVPILICLYVYFQPDQLPRVTAFAVLGIYIAFQAVVFAALRQRVKGWRSAGNWNLGSAGMLVNVVAQAYGIMAIYLLIKPGDTGPSSTTGSSRSGCSSCSPPACRTCSSPNPISTPTTSRRVTPSRSPTCFARCARNRISSTGPGPDRRCQGRLDRDGAVKPALTVCHAPTPSQPPSPPLTLRSRATQTSAESSPTSSSSSLEPSNRKRSRQLSSRPGLSWCGSQPQRRG